MHIKQIFRLSVALSTVLSLLLLVTLFTVGLFSDEVQSQPTKFGARDPGVRSGTPGAGGVLAGLTSDEQAAFVEGQADFAEEQTVQGTPDSELGLGPRFNGNGCGACHVQPAIGGTSPKENPQIEMAKVAGATNLVPDFITEDGPIREARFKRNPDGTPDGGVHALFTIKGRSDAPGCFLEQPNFAQALATRNVTFRIPTPVFGAGLIEAIPDSVIVAGIAGKGFGIEGKANRSGNDGTVTRFGWKAQNKSLLMFSGEAYNVEQGVTNELFPQERDEACSYNPTPENLGDINKFVAFMSALAPPVPAPETSSTLAGKALFTKIGCAACHTPTMTTGNYVSAALRNKPVNLYSDLLVHHMGAQLADDVSQGLAGGDEFRTAPLWGLGQRVFFLHDGRTSDLLEAIDEHAGPRYKPLKKYRHHQEGQGSYQPSEAYQVIQNWRRLNEIDKQHVLNFLRSL